MDLGGSDTALDAVPGLVRQGLDRLRVMSRTEAAPDAIVDALKRDDVVLVTGVASAEADDLLGHVAARVGLRERLELQAAFASIHGHRRNVGRYFMSVNEVKDYQFISVHSEGYRNMNMQLASFYCHQNTTDGGATCLFNVDDQSPVWPTLKDRVTRIDTSGRDLTTAEAKMLQMMHNLEAERDALRPQDEVLSEMTSPIAGVRMFSALARPEKTHSVILDRPLNVYWDSVSNTDVESGKEFLQFQRSMDLVRAPPTGVDESQMDYTFRGRVWRSGLTYAGLFKAAIVRRLSPGELIVQNNLTWPHAATNWTPGSGVRRMAAAFA